MIIVNGRDRALNTMPQGGVPDVSEALLDWFQPMVFTTVVTTVENFQSVETGTDINFQGVIQPLSTRQLMLKAQGERAWDWWWVHAVPALVLLPGQYITYQGEQYRVMGTKAYQLYGYVEYELVRNYTGPGAGP